MIDNEKYKQLRELVRLMEQKLGILEDGMTCCGVSLAQCHAIVEIGRAETISLIELSKHISLDNSTMSRTVNNLVKNKMAERELDPNDRRYVKIKLTQAGLTAFNKIESTMEKYYMKVFDSIPEDKRDQVLDSLKILLKVISENECCSC